MTGGDGAGELYPSRGVFGEAGLAASLGIEFFKYGGDAAAPGFDKTCDFGPKMGE